MSNEAVKHSTPNHAFIGILWSDDTTKYQLYISCVSVEHEDFDNSAILYDYKKGDEATAQRALCIIGNKLRLCGINVSYDMV